MAKFQWAGGNYGFYGYGQFGSYTMSDLAPSGVTLTFDDAHGSLDAEVLAASIHFVFTGVVSYTVENGPNAGAVRITGGALAEVHYLDAAGDEMLAVTGLAVALPGFLATLARGDAFSAWGMITHGVNQIRGSNDASGAGHAGTGDVLDTGALADAVLAGGGDDFIKDQGGADSYNGGTGFDTLAYDGWFFQPQWVQRGLDVDLNLGTITGPDGKVDKVLGIEAVIGTFKVDQFKGSGLGDKFTGLAGADKIDARGGFDFASYAGDAGQGGTDGIKVNLTAGTVRDGFGTVDRLVSVEGVEGTAVRDSFVDSASNNYFDGGAGNDSFSFSTGNDTGHGGAGADTFIFRGTAFDDDTIDDFSSADGDHIRFDAATSFGQLHLTNIKLGGLDAVNVQFASGSVTIVGVTAAQLHAVDFGF
ncbi:MAG: calcium-binding protein [Pseudorhodobacter sp.]|nr:calcium-binding protein [Pseudorhodobacter sp.]